MTEAIDTSILVAAMVACEPCHMECSRVLDKGKLVLYSHGIHETFNTLTGGKKGYRVPSETFLRIIETDFLPELEVVSLSVAETLKAMHECRSRGVRGAAIYDFLHLAAARKADATRFYTLNIAHFTAFHRAGDPEIVHPRDHGT